MEHIFSYRNRDNYHKSGHMAERFIVEWEDDGASAWRVRPTCQSEAASSTVRGASSSRQGGSLWSASGPRRGGGLTGMGRAHGWRYIYIYIYIYIYKYMYIYIFRYI